MQLVNTIKKFNIILSKHQKLRIFELAILMIIGGVLETCSVSLMLPFINAVMDPDGTMNNEYVKIVCNLFRIGDARTFLIFLAVVLALIYIMKNVYLLIEYNIQYSFSYNNMLDLQKRLLNNLIHRPYEFFLTVNSGEVIRIINIDSANVFQMLITLLQLFTEFVVSSMLIAVVFIMAPGVTAGMALVLLFLVAITTKILRPMLRDASVGYQYAAAGMNKWLLQSIQGIKEVKVTAKEKYFEKNYNIYGVEYVKNFRKNYVLGITPKFFIEAVCMSVMFLLVGGLIYFGTELDKILPMLSVVAMAAMRLLPSVNRISACMTSIAYNDSIMDTILKNLKELSGKEKVSLAMEFEEENDDKQDHIISEFKDRIVLDDITYRYPTGETSVLSHASLVIHKGQSVGIVGTSGAGKSTLVDVLLGVLTPQEGTVSMDGVDIREDVTGFLYHVGYIPQMIFMLDGTIRDNVAFGEEIVDDGEVWRALEEASLKEFVESLPDGIDTAIGERGIRVSGGQRQRIGIARALYHNPEILVFDEATSALDNETEKSIMESIDSLKGRKTMVIIAHRLTTIENCDVVYRVENGKIRRTKI